MKAKIIATPVKQRALRICFEQVPNGHPFIEHCFAWSYLGIKDSSVAWHNKDITTKKGKEVSRLSTQNLSELPFEKEVVYDWEKPAALSSFQEIFKEKNVKGYLIYLTFSDTEKGHVLALKFREESWRFMDPQVVQINQQHGYLHAQLNDEGKMMINKSQEMDVLEYVFWAYPSTKWIGVIALRAEAGSSAQSRL